MARKELAAYLVTSALFSSMTITELPAGMNGSYRSVRATARSLREPITTRSGRRKSSTANPSRRNSGLETTSNANFESRCFRMAASTFSLVPTGTVLLSTITLCPAPALFARTSRSGPRRRGCIWRSADPSSSGGVGRHRNTTCDLSTADSRSPENSIRSFFRLRRKISSSPRLVDRDLPRSGVFPPRSDCCRRRRPCCPARQGTPRLPGRHSRFQRLRRSSNPPHSTSNRKRLTDTKIHRNFLNNL